MYPYRNKIYTLMQSQEFCAKGGGTLFINSKVKYGVIRLVSRNLWSGTHDQGYRRVGMIIRGLINEEFNRWGNS